MKSKTKPHNGYWLRVTLDNECYNEIVGISSYAEMVYLVKRRYAYTPQLKHIELFVGTKLLEKKEKKDMTSFASYNAENAINRPFAKQVDKETLVAFGVPFNIVAALEVETDFINEQTGEKQWSINYDIDIDIKSELYQMAGKIKEIASSYRLSLPSNAFRRKQLTDLIQPTFPNGGMRAKLAKQGKTYVFADAS